MLNALATLWRFRGLAPWVVVAILGSFLWIERTKLAESRAETTARTAQLQTAVTANRDDAQAISTLRQALAQVRSQLAADQAMALAAASKAELQHQALVQSLDAASADLIKLEGDRTYAKFLETDLATAYPELAAGLRKLDASARGQD